VVPIAVSAKYYGLFFKSLCNKEVNLNSDTLKLMLCTSAYTPNQDTHQYKSSVTNEVTGPGYTAGGATVGSIAVAYNGGTNVLSIDGADVTWAASTITARYAVLYDSTPATDATRPLIGYVDFGADVTSTAANFSVVWDANGIATVTVS
jgi:hypothetical protein